MWSSRGLTLIGKILVANSLIASLFVHRLSVLPRISEQYLKQINKLIENFIWENKKPKIKTQILQANKEDGGLGLANLQVKHKALRIQWVYKTFENPLIAAMANDSLDNQIGEKLWEAHLTKTDIHSMFPRNNFWKEVLLDWQEYYYHQRKTRDEIAKRKTRDEIANTLIWYNSEIKIANKPVIYKNWYNSGVKYLKDILENNTILNFQQFRDKYQCGTLMKYNGIIDAIPQKWKQILQSNENIEKRKFDKLNDMKNTANKTKIVYRHLNTNDQIVNSKIAWLATQTGLDIGREQYIKYVQAINKITISTKLRSFQYHLLMNALITNIQLKIYGIKDTNLCTFCDEEIETLQHVFYGCKIVKPIWSKIAITRMWSSRGLTLIGKILVANSLIASLFVHRLSVLPRISEQYLKQINKLIENFIWENKKPKIKTQILQANKEDGGLGLANLQVKHKALRIQWVYKTFENPLIAAMANDSLDNRIGEKLWEAHLTKTDIHSMFPRNNFWKEVLLDWQEYYYHQRKTRDEIAKRKTRDEIANTLIWYNSEIKITNKPVIYKNWYNSGVKYLKDILENNTILNFQQFRDKYQCGTLMKYNGIIDAIPQKWKQILQSNENIEKRKFDKLNDMKNTANKTKIVYRHLNTNDQIVNSKIAWLATQTGLDIGREQYIKYVQAINKITISTKLRSFQYHLLMNALITNILLKIYGIKDTNLCTFCDEEIETLQHVFYGCKIVKPIWSKIALDYEIKEISYDKIICNNCHNNPKNVINCVVLIVKQYLYRNRCLQQRISYEACKQSIKEYEMIEEEIAKSKNKLNLHRIKWS